MKLKITFLITFLMYIGLQAQQTINASLTHDGEIRTYQIYLPSAHTETATLPMVFNLHGFGSGAIEQFIYSGFGTIAEAQDFILVTPQGLEGTTTWGATATQWDAYFGTGTDDLGFLNKLIDVMYAEYGIDLSRVYSTGMSNGGFMSYRLACEMSDRIAAIASVTGAMPLAMLDNCASARTMPILEIHGTADATVPYGGTPFFTIGAEEGVNWWVDHNNCATPAVETEIEDTNMSDMSTATSYKYQDCADDTQVWFYKITNGGHSWPGSFPVPGLGNTNLDFSASEVIWEFFSQFTHPNPADVMVGTEDFNAATISVYPNPFQETIVIENMPTTAQEIRLVDMTGQLIYQEVVLDQTQTIELDKNLSNGMYQILIFDGKKVYSERIVRISN